jgi:cytochrome c oxidase subunit 4
VSDSTDVATQSTAVAMADPGDVAAHHDAEAHHHPSPQAYVGIAIILAILTAGEVSLNYLEGGKTLEVIVLLVLMTIKFALIGMFFMHLKFDSPIFRRLFLTGLFLAMSIYAVMLAVEHVDL